MLETQSQISFDDDNDLFRQDTDAESDGEEQQELDDDDARDEELVDLLPAELKKEEEEEEEEKRKKKKKGPELDGTKTPALILPPKGKETILIVQPAKSPPTLDQPVAEKKKPLTLIELPVDVLKEIVKEVGLRHPPSAPPQLRVRQLLFYLPRLFLCGGGWGSSLLVWPRGGNFAADRRTRVGEPHERPHQPIAHVPLSPRPRHPPHLLPFRHRLARCPHPRRPHRR